MMRQLPTSEDFLRGFERMTDREQIRLLMVLIGKRSVIANVSMTMGDSHYAHIRRQHGQGEALILNCEMHGYTEPLPGDWPDANYWDEERGWTG